MSQKIISVIGMLESEIKRHRERASQLEQALGLLTNGSTQLPLTQRSEPSRRIAPGYQNGVHWTQTPKGRERMRRISLRAWSRRHNANV